MPRMSTATTSRPRRIRPTTPTSSLPSRTTAAGPGSSGIQVNSDNAKTDGYSEAFGGVSGRPQFLPSVAVDQSTGTLVMSWYDARNDAARTRVATYLTYSVDGGSTFSPQTYANISQTATDAITGKTVNLGPIPDNGRLNKRHDLRFRRPPGAGRRRRPRLSGLGEQPQRRRRRHRGPSPRHVDREGGHPRRAADHRQHDGAGRQPRRLPQQRPAADGTPIAQAFDVFFDRPVDPTPFDPTNPNYNSNLVQVLPRHDRQHPVRGLRSSRSPSSNPMPSGPPRSGSDSRRAAGSAPTATRSARRSAIESASVKLARTPRPVSPMTFSFVYLLSHSPRRSRPRR